MNVKELLNTDVDVIGSWIRTAFHWWLDELAQMAPQSWRGRLQRSRNPIVTIDGSQLTMDGSQADGATNARRTVDAVLAPKLVLVRKLDLPIMRLADVMSLVQFEIDRLTPFKAEDVFFDAEIEQRNDAAGTQRMRIGVLPRRTAAGAMALLTDAGLEPASLRLGGAFAGSTGHFDFLPAIRRSTGGAAVATRARILWIAVAILFAANVAVLVVRDMNQLSTLEEITASQRPVVTLARRLREKVDGETVARDLVLRSHAQSSVLQVMDNVTKVLPAGAWVQRFEWDGHRLHLVGYSSNTAALVSALGKLPGVVRIKDSSPASGDGGTARPFDIVADIKAGDR